MNQTKTSDGSYRKKLIEVAMPLEAINKASVREKSIRHGHPSTLHLYWARRPLASCRAVIFAQLVDDPSAHPEKFLTEEDQKRERERLFKIMEQLMVWENSNNESVLKSARTEIEKSWDGKPPPICDPFAGGWSIPLEAQRLGLPSYGSDLNPVATTIGKAMLEIPPLFRDCRPVHPSSKESVGYKNAEGLAEDVKYYSEWVKQQAFERIGQHYPQIDIGGKANAIAWIWARTVPSPDPALKGLPVPLVHSFDLSKVKGREAWVEPVVENGEYRFEIRSSWQGHERHGLAGTVNRNGAVCLVTGTAMPLTYVRRQAQQDNMGQRLMAIVAEGNRSKVYLPPSELHEQCALKQRRPDIDDIDLPERALSYSVQAYGMKTYGDLFTDRQLMALNTFSDLVDEAREKIERDARNAGMSDDSTPLHERGTGARAYSEAVAVYLGIIVSKCSDYWSALCSWDSSRQTIRGTFGRQAIPMVWDFAETNPFSSSTGSYRNAAEWVIRAVVNLPSRKFEGGGTYYVKQHDAQTLKYDPDTVVTTDPPYYDNIGYADLSDFFYCWLRPALKDIYPDIYGVMATPKSEELIASPYRHGSKEKAEQFFLNGMSKTIKNMASNTSDVAPAAIYYAFKQSEIKQEGLVSTGWATFLQAVIDSGYAVVGTWPMRTEMANRMVASGANALANSVVLVCRKRDNNLGTITRAKFIRQLKTELPKAIASLKAANIAPTDIPQSSIGPGIGIFSRYQKVLEANDSAMSVKTALQLINRELGEEEGEYDAETSFALTWFEQFGFEKGDFGDANNIANAKGIAADAMVHSGIARMGGGKFALLNREQLNKNWNPQDDNRVTIWECCQHLIKRLREKGEQESARLMKQMGVVQADAAKELAYALYEIAANKRKDTPEAAEYNGLISVWLEISAQADAMPAEETPKPKHQDLL